LKTGILKALGYHDEENILSNFDEKRRALQWKALIWSHVSSFPNSVWEQEWSLNLDIF
jgi:hypothetical protein